MNEGQALWIALSASAVAISCGIIFSLGILKLSDGNEKMREIAGAIQEGAQAYLNRQYLTIGLVGIVIFVLLGVSGIGWLSAFGFLIGAVLSGLAGYIGMNISVKANVRTAQAAHDGMNAALAVAFRGGAVTGLLVVGLGLLGISGYYFLLRSGLGISVDDSLHALIGLAFGGSLISIFARLGGGIFTKGADVGADLVGKIEAGIPEDDPRNPAVIADNVGDNVGDIAGMGSDIFESYCGSMIACIAIAGTFSVGTGKSEMMFLPLALASTGLIASMVGIIIVRVFSSLSPASALRTGTIGAPIVFIAASYFLINALLPETNEYIPINVWLAVLTGAVGGIAIGLITEYYTGSTPVVKIAESAQTGPATVMITGLSVGMQSVVLPIGSIAIIIYLSTTLSGIYGVGIAAVGMLSTVGITMAIDAYGPVADNAGGIAEMAGMPPETREITDELDEQGNTTAAIGKGFAIGAAALAALAIISAFVATVSAESGKPLELLLSDSRVLVGMFIGGAIPFLVASITMTAVGDAAFEMINEIRRQFKEIPGLLEGTAEPDTEKCVDIATTAALKKMLLPGVIAVGAPPLVGLTLGAHTLGGMLAGGLLSCVLMALFMANAGGAWDNAKKYIEKGNLGGKGTDTHAAAVVGDTVGDPFKDTSGPSMNILINVMAIVSLVIAPLL